MPLAVILTLADCESVHNNGCGPLPKRLDIPSLGRPRTAAMRRSEVERVEVLCGERGQRRHMHKSQVDMTGI